MISMGFRSVELSSSVLSSLGLPEHVGRGDAAIVRTTRGGGLYDTLTKLRSENEVLQSAFASPLHRPPQSQLEIGLINGKLTNENPLDRITLLRVGAALLDTAVLPMPKASSSTRPHVVRCNKAWVRSPIARHLQRSQSMARLPADVQSSLRGTLFLARYGEESSYLHRLGRMTTVWLARRWRRATK